MGVDGLDLLGIGPGKGQETMADPDADLADDMEGRLEQQLVDPGHGPAQGVFHRDDAVVETPVLDSLEDVLKFGMRQGDLSGETEPDGFLAERPVLALKADQ